MTETAKNEKHIHIGWQFLIAIFIIIFLIIFINYISIHDRQAHQSAAYRAICGSNLQSLGRGILIYASAHNNTYPPADKWCDLLIENSEGDLTKESKIFRCRGDEAGPCSYAMNPDCEPNSPDGVVLLFESKPGWNQHGGPELLNPDNHNGKGCNVLFNNFGVVFVKTEDFNDLKWK